MKKIITIVLLSLLTYTSTYSQSYLGFKGSFDINSLSTGSAKISPGFTVGAMYSTPIANQLFFQPSVLFNYTRVQPKSGYKPAYSAYTYSVEVPLILSRRIGDDEISFGVDFGAYTRYGLSGKYWVDDTATGERTRPDIFDHEKRFDVGPQVGFSMQIYGIYMSYAFQYGLIKPWDDRRGNNYSSIITFGYLFQVR